MDNELDALERRPVADGVSQSELIKALGGTPTHMLIDEPQKRVADIPEPTAADWEQGAFEKWLYDKCPSGDVESVERQWLESYEYAELLDEQEPERRSYA